MNIKKISIKGNGFGGLHVTHLVNEKDPKGRLFNNERIDKRKQPIHLGLENKFKELRPFLLDLCKVLRGDEEKMDKDFLINETDITGLQIVIDTTVDDGFGFVLEGSSVILGSKEIKFKTPKIESGDSYYNFDAVQLIIREIVEEVKAYMSGSIVQDDSEILLRWVEKSKDKSVDIETIKGLSPEEQKEMLTRVLEKMGAVVLFNEDVSVDNVDVSEELDSAQKNIQEDTIELNVNQSEAVFLKKA